MASDYFFSDFILDEWKKMYSNSSVEVSAAWLWEHHDPNAFTFWYCKYKYNNEMTVNFLAMNAIGGFVQRIEGLRKHAFGNLLLTKADGASHFEISGVWLIRGKKLAFNVRLLSLFYIV